MLLTPFYVSHLMELLNEQGIHARMHGDDTAITGLSFDSRTTHEHDLFICKGAAFQTDYLIYAQQHGAVAYLCDVNDYAQLASLSSLPALVVDNLRRAMALLAAAVYGHPEKHLRIFGITGTKGKTTTAYMLRHIFTYAHKPSSLIGSVETDDGYDHFESINTTPESVELWQRFRNTCDAGRSLMVMEVSSVGLKYERTLGVPFYCSCFLNIGLDHISPVEHPSFEDYLASKLLIFQQSGTTVINRESDHFEYIYDSIPSSVRILTYSTQQSDADFYAQDIHPTEQGMSFLAHTPTGDAYITLPLLGDFNVSNALAALAMAYVEGIPLSISAAALATVHIPGRMELFSTKDARKICIVDYAHNALSFNALFSTIKEHYPHRKIVAVFGAAGCKALERRHDLPDISSAYADLTILTEDEPWLECVEDICAEMATNIRPDAPYRIEYDREQACKLAFSAFEHDELVVLLLGKGRETHMRRGTTYDQVKSDTDIAQELISVYDSSHIQSPLDTKE